MKKIVGGVLFRGFCYSRTDNESSGAPSVTSWEEQADWQVFKFHLGAPLVVNATYRLSVTFSGTTINSDLAGLYRSSYEEDGVKKFVIIIFIFMYLHNMIL